MAKEKLKNEKIDLILNKCNKIGGIEIIRYKDRYVIQTEDRRVSYILVPSENICKTYFDLGVLSEEELEELYEGMV